MKESSIRFTVAILLVLTALFIYAVLGNTTMALIMSACALLETILALTSLRRK